MGKPNSLSAFAFQSGGQVAVTEGNIMNKDFFQANCLDFTIIKSYSVYHGLSVNTLYFTTTSVGAFSSLILMEKLRTTSADQIANIICLLVSFVTNNSEVYPSVKWNPFYNK